MVITEIVNFNKEDSEAEVRVSDGDYSVECYVYPAEMSVFEKQSNVIDRKKSSMHWKINYQFGCRYTQRYCKW